MPEAVAQTVVAESSRSRLAVPLGRRTYAIDVVHAQPEAVATALDALGPSSVVVVTDSTVGAARRDSLNAIVAAVRTPVSQVVIRPGEENKTLDQVQAIWDGALAGQADRRSVVLAFGGGVVGDLAGFAAATFLRGVRVVQAPTTLLSMVDSSVGGKTGFDLPRGKNLIGAFHQPSAVVVDLAHLTTLPARDVRAGLAEAVKVALACDEGLWLALEAGADRLREGDVEALRPVVLRALALKTRIVRDDEREAGARALLNLGHTLGHAIEAAGGYARHLHGEAVGLGLVLETLVAERLGVAATGLSARVTALLGRLGLPVALTPEALAASWPYVASDKKRVGDTLSFPLVKAIAARRSRRSRSRRSLAR